MDFKFLQKNTIFHKIRENFIPILRKNFNDNFTSQILNLFFLDLDIICVCFQLKFKRGSWHNTTRFLCKSVHILIFSVTQKQNCAILDKMKFLNDCAKYHYFAQKCSAMKAKSFDFFRKNFLIFYIIAYMQIHTNFILIFHTDPSYPFSYLPKFHRLLLLHLILLILLILMLLSFSSCTYPVLISCTYHSYPFYSS